MQHTNYIIENPESASKPLNARSLNAAMTACKLREQFTIECQKRNLPIVPAFPYIGFQENAGFQYTGDHLDGFTIDCSDNEFLDGEYSFFILGKKNNLLSLFKFVGCETMGDINDLELFKDQTDDQFNIVYKFGEAIQQLIEDGLIKLNKKANKPKKEVKMNVISALKITSVKSARVADKPAKKAVKKAPSLKALSKADLLKHIELLQSSS
jgi:hypothetical protein